LKSGERRATRWLGTLTDIDARKRAEDQQRIVGEASALLASSLDYEARLADVAELIVPMLADGCAIDLLDERGVLRRVAASDADPQKRDLVARMRALPPPPPDAPVHRIFASRRATVAPRVTPEDLAANARSDDHREILLGLGPRSLIVAPMRARGKAIGMLWLYCSSSGRAYDDSSLAIAQELANRVALAVDNARLYRDAQNAVRLRDEFLSIASHELKTPLTPLKLQIARLRREVPGESAASKLEVAERQVDRLTRLITQLLDVSRIQGERLELEPETTDLVRVVKDAVAEHARELAHKGCEVKLDTPRELAGSWDRMRLDQVVSNLLSNAIKYGQGKPIEIRVEATPDEAILSVRDHGIGIDDANQARIFGRFERAVSVRHYGGFGLGLWIARKVVEASGGSIDVTSAPGQGSTFRVRLPRR
jgi:signal transduction histidine kinase